MATWVLWLGFLPAVAVILTVWERRKFRHHQSYKSVNIALAYLGAGLVLMAPGSDLMGTPVATLTGMWHSEDILGHTLLIVGMGYLVAHGLKSFERPSRILRRGFKAAMIVLAALLWAVWLLSDMAATDDPTVYRTGGVAYWWVFILGVGALSAIVGALFLTISRQTRLYYDARIARCYLAANVFLVAACANRGVELVRGDYSTPWLVADYLLRTVAVVFVVYAAHNRFRRLSRPLHIPSYMTSQGSSPGTSPGSLEAA